ncbi:FkbM family methyltransferase [Micromonospora sp. STR1s_5]|nr:FkbM family methyltransferase [Micromonospora sp. STR1s_5]
MSLTAEQIKWAYEVMVGRTPDEAEVSQSQREDRELADLRERLYGTLEFHKLFKTLDYHERWVLAPIFKGERKIWINLSDKFVSYGCLIDAYEPAETALVLSLLTEESHFLDIGANVGWFTLAASTIIKTGTIVAFEPNPKIFARLRASVEVNGLSATVKALPIAVGEGAGTLGMSTAIDSRNPGSGFIAPDNEQQTAVQAGTIDELIGGGQCDVVKIDVEGYELKVLRGAVQTFSRCRPHIVMEYSPEMLNRYGDSADDLERLLAQIGATAFVLSPDGTCTRPETLTGVVGLNTLLIAPN